MKKVNLYIYSSLNCTKTAKTLCKAGCFILEYPTQKGPVTYTETVLFSDIAQEMTANRSYLILFERALKRINTMVELDLYIDNLNLSRTIENHWLQQWASNGWMASSGKQVKYAEDWKRIHPLLACHKVHVHLKEHHSYKEWMIREAKKELNYVKEVN